MNSDYSKWLGEPAFHIIFFNSTISGRTASLSASGIPLNARHKSIQFQVSRWTPLR